ncbi:hypothetical protein BH11ACT4_BH11ACT4_20440 [soil metagenome]
MRAVRMRGVAAGFAGVVLAASLLLTGCSAPASGGGTGGSGQSGSDSGSSSNGSGTSTNPGGDTTIGQGIPATFPQEVPLISGDAPVGLDLGTGWTVVVKTTDFGKAFADATGKLKAAGFTAQVESSSADGAFGAYASDKYEVQVTGANTPDYGPCISYVVVLKG